MIKKVKPDGKHKSGTYNPVNPGKYIGPTPIIYRSSYEYKYCIYCDTTDDIVQWSSEPLKIPYKMPLNENIKVCDGKIHHYYPDFFIKAKQKDGSIKKYLIELKPENHLKKPKEPTKRVSKKATQNYIFSVNTYLKNYYKAQAAKDYAKKKGWEYKIITQKSLK